MIHYLGIVRDKADTMRFTNNDGNDGRAHDRIRAVELTAEQHYGIHVYDDEQGKTWVELREGGAWSAPLSVQELVHAHR